jgi:benzoyl-CoA reductase subunit C
MSAEIMDGLATAERYYTNYGIRVRELNKEGRKIMGYLCALTPVEIIAAAGFIPFRIKGDAAEPITKADAQMETIVCPIVRSFYDLSLKGRYDFLDGLVIPHACDSICRSYDIWKNTLGLPYNHLINMPHGTDDSSVEFYKEILKTFIETVFKHSGNEYSKEGMVRTIKAYNQNRARVRELLQLRKLNPPAITGTEITRTMVACMSLPVGESTKLITNVINETKQRKLTKMEKSTRIMVIGAQVDDSAFIHLIEELGASVVIDDLCPGTREYWPDIDITPDPIDGLTERYLRKVKCGRTYREQKGTYEEYLEDRFGHIGNFIKEFKVEGVILYIYKYCDPFGFEIPALKSYIESKNTPVLYIEDQYSTSAIARLRTRIQAFLEILG